MKKLYKSLLLGLLAIGSTLPAAAQQVPNADFEGGWVDCTPWTSDPNTKKVGKTPNYWCISHVAGMSGTGATQVGQEVDGYNSTSAAKLINSPNSILQSQSVPGYMTLGTTWSTAKGMNASNPDGGSFGGIAFTYRPDAMGFMYQRERKDGTEKSTILFYSWKGEWTQEKVPANIGLLSTKTVTMVNRDVNILGKSYSQGGTVKASEDAELISVLEYDITDTESTTDWTEFYQEIEYKSNATPTMMNIVFSAGDYFGGKAVIKQGNSLTVDNVKLYYYSRLESLTAGDITVTPDEDAIVAVDAEYDADAISLKLIGQTAEATSEYDEATGILTVTVSNVDADRDGKSSHVYTFQFNVKGGDPEPPVEVTGDPYAGYLNVSMMDSPLAVNKNTTVFIDHADNGTCTFTLPNFSLSEELQLGNIVVPNTKYETAADGTVTYTGVVEGMELLGGMLTADVTLDGTIKDGDVNMNINVTWEGMPIPVTFTTKPLNAQYFDGYLNVEMMGSPLAENESKQITIFPTMNEAGEATCTFMLPDFTLATLGDESIGDIVVDNVTTTQQCDIVAYEGYVPALELLDGELIAEVSLEGTINDNNIVKMFIDVVWDGISIPVTFTTNEIESTEGLFDTEEEIAIQLSLDDLWKLVVDPMDNVTFESDNDDIAYVSERNYIIPVSDGVCNITATRQAATRSVDTKTFQVTVTSTTGVQSVVISTANGETEYYDLRGVKVDINNAPAGIYISRQGNKAIKFVK
ncbi:MAG: hypothetical protein J1E63_11210 [Muribaculaceae bacterium]|nr:hypothetical protein [Muribaculaceae bacterium]